MLCYAKSLQSCPTLCDPRDRSPPGSPIPGILQARTLEWVAISFSNAWKWKVRVKSLSRVRLLATPWTAAYQAPPSMGFSKQEYWSGVPLPSPAPLIYLYSFLHPTKSRWRSLCCLPPGFITSSRRLEHYPYTSVLVECSISVFSLMVSPLDCQLLDCMNHVLGYVLQIKVMQ